MEPLVSVNIIVYNREDFIYQSIQSIVDQDYKNLEIIIINDGSTDNTLSVINTINDSRIKISNNADNRGIAYSRNLAAKFSNGSYILIFDSDDIAHKTLISEKVKFLNKHHDYIIVSNLMNYIDQSGNYISKSNGILVKDHEIPIYLFFSNCLVHSSILIRAEILKNNNYSENFRSEDYHLWIRICQSGKIHILNKAFVDVRFHTKNATISDKHDPEKGVEEIVKLGLEKFQLTVPLNIQKLHVFFLNNTKVFTINELKLLIRHLGLLIETNNKFNIYPKKQFKKFIIEKIESKFNYNLKVHELTFLLFWIFVEILPIKFKISLCKSIGITFWGRVKNISKKLLFNLY